MRAGDTVLHRPSGEKWSVAYVEDDRLAWRGWPLGTALVSDCELIRSCSDEEHAKVLTEMAEMRDSSDPRRSRARHALGLDH